MQKTYIITDEHGLVGLNKCKGDIFEAEDTAGDIMVLMALGKIEEYMPPKKSEPQKIEPPVEPPQEYSTQSLEPEETETSSPKSRTYRRRDMRPEK